MSWPADGRPRFKAAVIGGGWTTDARPEAIGYVYDRAYSHGPVLDTGSNSAATALARAELEAEILNVGDEHPEAQRRATLTHGAKAYRHRNCRCPICVTAKGAEARESDARLRAKRR